MLFDKTQKGKKKVSEPEKMSEIGVNPFNACDYQFIESYKQAIFSCFTKLYYPGPMQNNCVGCQLSSEWFPSHQRFQISPQTSSKDVYKREFKSSKDVSNIPTGRSTTVSTNPSSVDDNEKVNLENNFSIGSGILNTTEKCKLANKHSLFDILEICINRFIDKIADHFYFISTSTFVVALIYIEKFVKINKSKSCISTKCIKRQILTFFLLACKFNEDFQLPKQYILEFCRNTKAVSLQSDLNKWEAGCLMAIDNNLFVKENQYLSKMHSLQLSSNAFGLKSYSLIENYFPEPKINKENQEKSFNKKQCVILLDHHIFNSTKAADHYFCDKDGAGLQLSLKSVLSLY